MEFIGGNVAFLWPPRADGIGVEHRIGTLEEVRLDEGGLVIVDTRE